MKIKSDQFNIGNAESFAILYWIGCRIIIRDESLKKRMFTSVKCQPIPPFPKTGDSQMSRITTEKQFQVQNICLCQDICSIYWPKMQLVKRDNARTENILFSLRCSIFWTLSLFIISWLLIKSWCIRFLPSLSRPISNFGPY